MTDFSGGNGSGRGAGGSSLASSRVNPRNFSKAVDAASPGG
jgi:hypothetical protein